MHGSRAQGAGKQSRAKNRPQARFLAKLPRLKAFVAIALSFVLTTGALVVLWRLIEGAPSVWPFVVLCVVVAAVAHKAASWLVGKVFKGTDKKVKPPSPYRNQGAVALAWLALTTTGRSLFAGRLVERGDLCIAQSAIVETDVIQPAIEPMRHVESTPAYGGWHARLGCY